MNNLHEDLKTDGNFYMVHRLAVYETAQYGRALVRTLHGICIA